MKTNHLFASAAYAAVLVAALPAHAQILGGGMHGGVTGMQAATFGGGFGAVGRSASGRTDLSASGRADGRVDGVGRVDRTAKEGTQEAARDAGHAKADAAVAGRQTVGAGEFEASKAGNAALGTTRAAAGSTAATSVTAAGQGEAQARNVDAVGALGGGLSATEVPGAKLGAGNPKPSAGQPAATTKPDSLGTPRHSSASGDSVSSAPSTKTSNGDETRRSAGSQGEADANASASVNASATH
jgi:hypothetical protein